MSNPMSHPCNFPVNDNPAIKALLESPELFITPDEAAPVLGVHPHSIRLQAHDNPAMLGFSCTVIGTRTLIPRVPFLRFVGVDI